eukprot:Plantae.Rhodophyta-Hildenbrandia_rubra.ctg1442.p1 GENE.Plantae.Rhodophyta-Hildenbrandia_rubra.ctg1442~~Plantae.Rhodophyta-Hildenbrandia_rubra.ctg1442.p1  ORF type:complete len:290 (-),score=63.30 Plantae.Rhodophyta-Hildenbrandia_rubra.ctg1442:422-1291(-)
METSTTAPPQAPKYPSLTDDVVKEVDDSEYTSATSNLTPAKDNKSSTIMTDSSTYTTPVRNSTGVPKVHLPVSSGKSRLRKLLMWEDRKFSAVMFTLAMLFFYLTLWKGLSILSVSGALFGLYLLSGTIIVYVNQALNGPFDKFVKKPPRGEPFFRKEVVEKWTSTFMDMGNELADDIRDVLYCENPKVSSKWMGISFGVYVLGIWFSPLVLLFLATIFAFSLPLLYHRNKKQVDDAAAKALEVSRAKAAQAYELSARKAVQAKKAVSQTATPYLKKAGLTADSQKKVA